MNLNTLVSNNYREIYQIAIRISGRKNVDMAGDLISQTYIELIDDNKHYTGEAKDFIKWYSKAMKNLFRWSEAGFNRIFETDINKNIKIKEAKAKRYKKKTGQYINDIPDKYQSYVIENVIDNSALNDIEFSAEECNDSTRELLEVSQSIGTESALKYVQVIDFKRKLIEHEKILFELYFEKRLSTREIAIMYSDKDHKMNYQSVNSMVNNIKAKIKQTKWG